MQLPFPTRVRKLSAAVLAFAAILLSVALPFNASAFPAGAIKRGDGFTMVLQTEELKDYLKFDGSPLHKVVRVKVSYFSGAGQPQPYQEFFYSDGDVLGMRRLNPLSISACSAYVLHLVHKDGSADSDERRAGANAALRVWMNMKRNHCLLTCLHVEEDSLPSVSDELQRLRFSEVEPPSEGTIDHATVLTVVSDSYGRPHYFGYNR